MASMTSTNDAPGALQADEVQAAIAAGSAVLVDVREPAAYAEGHPAGAINVPIGELEARLGELPEGVTVVTSCGGGTRGPRAAELVAGLGRDARVLHGGLRGWRAAGLPVE
jgi:rhodanese-related sulfurtransferase